MREPAETNGRNGCPRIYMRLRREGWRVDHKKIERLYREEGLSLCRRARKKATAIPRVALPLPSEPGSCYAMDCPWPAGHWPTVQVRDDDLSQF